MVGIGTVIKDNPMLNCRIEGGRNPVRIVCDSYLNIPLDCNLVSTAKDIRTIVATIMPEETEARYKEHMQKENSLRDKGVEIIHVEILDGKVNLNDLMIKLGELGIDGILLEGGGTLNYSALNAGIVNEVQVYIAPKIFGGSEAISPVEGLGVESPDLSFMFDLKNVKNIENDILLTYVKKGGCSKCSQE